MSAASQMLEIPEVLGRDLVVTVEPAHQFPELHRIVVEGPSSLNSLASPVPAFVVTALFDVR